MSADLMRFVVRPLHSFYYYFKIVVYSIFKLLYQKNSPRSARTRSCFLRSVFLESCDPTLRSSNDQGVQCLPLKSKKLLIYKKYPFKKCFSRPIEIIFGTFMPSTHYSIYCLSSKDIDRLADILYTHLLILFILVLPQISLNLPYFVSILHYAPVCCFSILYLSHTVSLLSKFPSQSESFVCGGLCSVSITHSVSLFSTSIPHSVSLL
jgi:hypothetical protein